MGGDNFTEVTGNSCCGNVVGSCIGALIGIVMLIVSFPLLWWNESRAVERERALGEAQGIVVSAQADSVNSANEDKLVYLTGAADTKNAVLDKTFNVSRKALRLKRTVEMYQWEETKESETQKDFGGGSHTVTTYHYQKKWSDQLIDSSSFHHAEGHSNPESKPFETKEFTANKVTLNAFTLPPFLLEKMTWYSEFPVSDEMLAHVPSGTKDLQVVDGKFYRGNDADAPKVGDVRVGFASIPPGPISLVAKQTGSSFAAYHTAHGEVALLQSGVVAVADMFQKARDENTVLTWVLRGVGWFLMLLGILLAFNPAAAVANVIPLLGDLIGFAAFIAALFISIALAFFTIALAWVTVRPLLGIPMLLAGVGLLVLGLRMRGRRRQYP